MSELFRRESGPKSRYFDKQCGLTEEEYKERLLNTCTVYVGASHHGGLMCRESQIYHFFEKCGRIFKVVQSKHKKEKKNCGFYFVVFQIPEGARNAVSYLNRSRLDRRVLKVDLDVGFSDGREFGRGDLGGQKRDDFNEDGTKKPVPVEEDQGEKKDEEGGESNNFEVEVKDNNEWGDTEVKTDANW